MRPVGKYVLGPGALAYTLSTSDVGLAIVHLRTTRAAPVLRLQVRVKKQLTCHTTAGHAYLGSLTRAGVRVGARVGVPALVDKIGHPWSAHGARNGVPRTVCSYGCYVSHSWMCCYICRDIHL